MNDGEIDRMMIATAAGVQGWVSPPDRLRKLPMASLGASESAEVPVARDAPAEGQPPERRKTSPAAAPEARGHEGSGRELQALPAAEALLARTNCRQFLHRRQ